MNASVLSMKMGKVMGRVGGQRGATWLITLFEVMLLLALLLTRD